MTLGIKDDEEGVKIVKRKVRSTGRTAGQSGNRSRVEGFTTRMSVLSPRS
jgi:hypothetical protein